MSKCRGADSDQPAEFARQRTKLIAALAGLDADVIGLNEIENTPGVEPLADIVAGLPGYAYVDTGIIGTDAIRVGLALPSCQGRFQLAHSRSSTRRSIRAFSTARIVRRWRRPSRTWPMAVASPLSSITSNRKGRPVTMSAILMRADGQGTATQPARLLHKRWWTGWPRTRRAAANPDFLILGDLNSYAREDPIHVIKKGADDTLGTGDDYTNLIARLEGDYAYSYTFDGQAGYLDHALVTPSLLAQVTGATHWHINSDEPDILDYDTSFKSAAQDALYEPNAYRVVRTHDALVVGLNVSDGIPPTLQGTVSRKDSRAAPARSTFP